MSGTVIHKLYAQLYQPKRARLAIPAAHAARILYWLNSTSRNAWPWPIVDIYKRIYIPAETPGSKTLNAKR